MAPESKSHTASPLVSVVVPAYNRAAKIRACVQSVIEQSHRPLELLVVDDGSTDETWAVLSEMVFEFSALEEFSFVPLRQSNHGAPSARNYGVEESKGEWIQFLDSDDQLLPDKISKGLRLAQKHSAQIAYCRAQYVTEREDPIDRYVGRKLSGDWKDHFEFSWQTMCAIYSREALDRIGKWNEDLAISQDWEFCIRAVVSGLTIYFDDATRALYRCEGSDRIGTGNSLKKNQGQERALWAVWDLLDRRNLLVPKLRARFRSRFMYVFLSYCSLGDRDARIALCKRMRNVCLVGWPVGFVMRIFPPVCLAAILLKLFQVRVARQVQRAKPLIIISEDSPDTLSG